MTSFTLQSACQCQENTNFQPSSFLSTHAILPDYTECIIFIPGKSVNFQHVKSYFFLSLSLLICWPLSIWICRKPFFSLLYNCPLLGCWRLALIIVVEVFPRPFSRLLLLHGCLLQTPYA